MDTHSRYVARLRTFKAAPAFNTSSRGPGEPPSAYWLGEGQGRAPPQSGWRMLLLGRVHGHPVAVH